MSIEEEYQKVISAFPNAKTIDNYISHIKLLLLNDVHLQINFKKYPKKPKVQLVNPDGQAFKNLESMVSTLKYWDKKHPHSIVGLINDIKLLLERAKTNEIAIKRELIEGVLALCKNQHPREILGYLRVERGVVCEYILLPGASTDEKSGVFFPRRVPNDPSLQGTIHSHPTGNPYPSQVDLETVFMSKRFHFIAAYPYNYASTKCFDQKGNELVFKII